MSGATTPPVTMADLRHQLLETGRIGPSAHLSALTGGVSSLVARVDDAGASWVVKAPLSQLAVPDDWAADRGRGNSEAAALRLLDGHLGPVRVPRLLFFDPVRTILGQELVPGPPPTYKEELLEGRARPGIATALAEAVSLLHRLGPPHELDGPEPRRRFDELRLDPYYRTTARRRPELAPGLEALVDETTAAEPRRLVHGDFTPKNVLVGHDAPVLVDWEVAHAGDAAFDLATLTAHLLLKSLRDDVPRGIEPLLESVCRFWDAYDGPADRPRAIRHTGAVMLARLFGKSPVEYMGSPAARDRAYGVGRLALDGKCPHVTDLLQGTRLFSRRRDDP